MALGASLSKIFSSVGPDKLLQPTSSAPYGLGNGSILCNWSILRESIPRQPGIGSLRIVAVPRTSSISPMASPAAIRRATSINGRSALP